MAALLAYDGAYRQYAQEALAEAVEGEHANAVSFLVEVAGADVNMVNPVVGETPVHYAVLRPDIIRVLVEAGAALEAKNFSGRTPLMRVSCANSEQAIQAVEVLLSLGADIHAVNDDGETSLMCAAEWGHPDIVSLLITHDISVVNDRDDWGETALILAASKGRAVVAKRLIAAGALVDMQTEKSAIDYLPGELTALLYASARGHLDVVRVLVAAGASLDIPGEDGWTPLMHAVRRYDEDMVDVLLRAGAGVNHSNLEGKTALGIVDNMPVPSAVEAIRAMLIGAGAVY